MARIVHLEDAPRVQVTHADPFAHQEVHVNRVVSKGVPYIELIAFDVRQGKKRQHSKQIGVLLPLEKAAELLNMLEALVHGEENVG